MLKELQLNNRYEVTILKQDHFGNGITKLNDKYVFVKGGLPEDICEIEITNIKKNYVVAKIIKLIKKSPFRTEPKCPYYDTCGGCHIMHETYQNQLIFKELKVKELLEKFANLKDITIYPIKYQNPFNYRNKVIFHGENNKLGFYEETTHKIVQVEECITTNKKINEIYKQILNFVKNNKENNIKKLMIRITSLNDILVVLEGKINKEKLLSHIDKNINLYLNNDLIQGNSHIIEEIDNIKFKIYPNSFFQINYDMMLELYKTVVNYYKTKNYHKVLDLYCGTGTIGMLVSPYVEEVIGVEVEKSSIESANECRKINRISNISFIEGKVEDNINIFKDIDSIIVDPPRSGLDKHTIETILELTPKTITYISCDPVTLARDLNLLLSKYIVKEIHPVDMFPNTYHIETIAFLKRK